MLSKVVSKLLTNSILSSMKGKKRWLLIVVLVVANLLQGQGVDLADFIEELVKLIDNAEG